MKKKVFIHVIGPCLKFFFSFIFERKYLMGKHFDCSLVGWKWAFRSLFTQIILRQNAHVKWPVSTNIAIDFPEGIFFHPDDMNNFQHFGCYFSNANYGKITIGHNTWIAPNVGIITTNHSLSDVNKHEIPEDVYIGNKCWLGMNVMILPGVRLGDNTIVGAGSVVTKSFEQGNCVIAGNPAKVIKSIGNSNDF